jgi:hypothetical protein
MTGGGERERTAPSIRTRQDMGRVPELAKNWSESQSPVSYCTLF